MDIWHFIAYIITPLLVLVVGIFNLYLNSKFADMEKRIEKCELGIEDIEAKANGLKDNYVNKFSEVNKNMNDNKIEVLNALHKIDLCVTKISDKVDEQSKFCSNVQLSKRG